MNRFEAITRIVQQNDSTSVNRSNVHFANINSSKDVWWLDIPINKLSQRGDANINLLLYDQRSRTLHHLEVPNAYFREQERRLVTRNEKGCISLELSTENISMFRDIRPGGEGVEFRQFLKESI